MINTQCLGGCEGENSKVPHEGVPTSLVALDDLPFCFPFRRVILEMKLCHVLIPGGPCSKMLTSTMTSFPRSFHVLSFIFIVICKCSLFYFPFSDFRDTYHHTPCLYTQEKLALRGMRFVTMPLLFSIAFFFFFWPKSTRTKNLLTSGEVWLQSWIFISYWIVSLSPMFPWGWS